MDNKKISELLSMIPDTLFKPFHDYQRLKYQKELLEIMLLNSHEQNRNIMTLINNIIISSDGNVNPEIIALILDKITTFNSAAMLKNTSNDDDTYLLK